MSGPESLRVAARFYLRESEHSVGQKDKKYFAEYAYELAQMAEALEREIIDQIKIEA